jgi:hypothetical protein
MCGEARQGMLAPATRGWIQLEGKLNPAEALDGIQQFSHVWIVFVFHQNTNASKYQPGLFLAHAHAWTPVPQLILSLLCPTGPCSVTRGSKPRCGRHGWAEREWGSSPRAHPTDPIPSVLPYEAALQALAL